MGSANEFSTLASRYRCLSRTVRDGFQRTVETPVRPLWKHTLYVYGWAYVPGLLATFVVALLFAAATDLELPRTPALTWQRTVLAVIVAPIVETIGIAVLVGVLGVWIRSTTKRAVLIGVISGLLHAIQSPYRFPGPAWGFTVMTFGFQAWYPTSLWRAYLVAAVAHALGNGTTMAMLWTIQTYAM